MFKAGDLRKTWEKVAPGVVIGVPIGIAATLGAKGMANIESARTAWAWAVSDEAANMWQMVMAVMTIIATPFLGLGLLEYLDNQKKAREEAVEKRKSEEELKKREIEESIEKRKAQEEHLKIQREEIDAELVAQYIGVLDDFIEHPELDIHNELFLNPVMAQRQQRIYEKLIVLFATAFRRLHGENDEGLKEQWYAWEDDIADWIALHNFRSALPELLTGETEEFISYMERKREEIPENTGAAKAPKSSRKRRSRAKAAPESVPGPSAP